MRTLITLVVWLATATAALAANPADTTNFHRPIGSFQKLAWDGGSWYGFASQAVAHNTTITYYHWQDKTANIREDEIMLIGSLNSHLDVALAGDWWKGGKHNFRKEIGLDVHSERLALGVVVPLQQGDSPSFGPRARIGEFTLYANSCHGQLPLYGLSWSQHGACVDTAIGADVLYLRASRRCGQFLPELRTKWGKNPTIGFALGFAP